MVMLVKISNPEVSAILKAITNLCFVESQFLMRREEASLIIHSSNDYLANSIHIDIPML